MNWTDDTELLLFSLSHLIGLSSRKQKIGGGICMFSAEIELAGFVQDFFKAYKHLCKIQPTSINRFWNAIEQLATESGFEVSPGANHCYLGITSLLEFDLVGNYYPGVPEQENLKDDYVAEVGAAIDLILSGSAYLFEWFRDYLQESGSSIEDEIERRLKLIAQQHVLAPMLH